MRIAIPLIGGRPSPHFGHSETFALFDVDPTEKRILARKDVEAPPHAHGLFPKWLATHGVECVLAGGMGPGALGLLKEQGIRVILGVAGENPERLVTDYLSGTLKTEANRCEHGRAEEEREHRCHRGE